MESSSNSEGDLYPEEHDEYEEDHMDQLHLMTADMFAKLDPFR